MEDLNVQVLRGFQMKNAKIRKDKSSYIVYTGDFAKKIRKIQTNPDHIIFQHNVKEYLFKYNFDFTDRFSISTQNKPYFLLDGTPYVMTDYIDLPESDFQNPTIFKQIIKHIGTMHILLQDLPFGLNFQKFNKESIPVIYEKSLREMQQIKKRLGTKKRLSDFDVIFLKNFTFYSEQITIALQHLNKNQWDLFVQNTMNKTSVCHNLLKEENVLVKGDKTYITNFFESSTDHYLFDIVHILQRYTKNISEDSLDIRDILSAYCETNPLTQESLEILYPLLKFPKKYIKICRQYYSKNRTWAPNAMYVRLQEVVEKKDQYNDFIENLKHL